MRQHLRLVAACCAALVGGHAGAVGNSLLNDGRVVYSGWYRQPGDLYSGTAFLVGAVRDGLQTMCSGTLIAPTVILTAAHCRNAIGTAYFVDDVSNGYLGRYVGISVSRFVPHPNYSAGGPEHDLALAFLKSPAPASARIAKIWKPSGLDKPYSGTVFMGGYGVTRDGATGALRSSPRAVMQGTIDGLSSSAQMPLLNVGSNHLSHPATASSAALVGKTDFDRWFPTRAGALRDADGKDLEGQGFDYDRQRSPYGWTQKLVDGKRVFTGGGTIWYPHHMESATLSGDSGSAVFYNPRALVENVLWHTAYDDMVALGGVPNDSILFFLKTAYQDDTNYVIGVTSSTWVPAGAGCSASDCFSANALASNGGGNYTLVLPHLPWINSVLSGSGIGTLLGVSSTSTGTDSSASYAEFATLQTSLEPDAADLQIQPAPGMPQLATFTLTSANVTGCRAAYGNVRLSAPAPAEGLEVTILDTLAAATPPSVVRLAAGAISKNFTIKTQAVAAAQSGQIIATFAGVTLSQDLSLRPMGVAALSLTPTTVPGGGVVAGSAKLDCAAGPGPIQVDLSSTAPGVANPVLASVLVPVGTQTVAFQVATSAVATITKPKIAARANGIIKSKTLTVTPP